jgi:hypothetical protein
MVTSNGGPSPRPRGEGGVRATQATDPGWFGALKTVGR